MTAFPARPRRSLGMAVLAFRDTPLLPRLIAALMDVGFEVKPFTEAGAALTFVLDHGPGRLVVVADADLAGVMNGIDLSTVLAERLPALPIVLADHFDGTLAPNVVCLDKPWTLHKLTEQVLKVAAGRVAKG